MWPHPFDHTPSQQKVDDGIDMFADEHMVEMNRRPGLRSPRPRRRSRSPTPTPPRLTKPSTQPHTLNEEAPTPPEATNHANSAEISEPLPFVSSSLPEENSTGSASVQPMDSNSTENKTNSLHSSSVDKSTEVSVSSADSHAPLTNNIRSDDKTAVEKVQATSRKRERTPSPTYSVTKRPALNNSSLTKFTSSALPTKTSSKVTGGGLKSSASKVLTEELQKQQGQENSRLKGLIVKEVRKPGKSEWVDVCDVCDLCEGVIVSPQTMMSSSNTWRELREQWS